MKMAGLRWVISTINFQPGAVDLEALFSDYLRSLAKDSLPCRHDNEDDILILLSARK